MPDFFNYQKSVANEFKAYEKRVRDLIDDAHWGEEGRYKEIILMNYLKRVLPKNISVGTGFIRNKDKITSQIDIIIYDNSFPLLFSEGDFIVAVPENVIGIIEVKTRIEPAKICEILKKANNNANIISADTDMFIFNGIFSFNSTNSPEGYISHLEEYDYQTIMERRHFNQIIPSKLYSCVNHIALGKGYFIKLWPIGQNDDIDVPHYSIYNMQDGLAFSYFLSNLQEFIIRKTKGFIEGTVPKEMEAFFYPIPEGKESRLIKRICLMSRENE